MDATTWVDQNVPDQTGRTIVITGSSAGLGADSARLLARRGAKVVIAVRTVAKGQGVADSILADQPDADLEVRELDLASLASVRSFAESANADLGTVDVLLNNAGVMAPPRSETADGFEMQMGTNHLGHFALTGLLQPALLAADGQGRVVNISSIAATQAKMDLDDLNAEKSYSRWGQYGRTKLANILFTMEHGRRATAAGLQTTVVAAHPGLSATDLVKSMRLPGPIRLVGERLTHLMAQPSEMGALAGIAASTDPDLSTGDYVGPQGMREMKGLPGPAHVPGRGRSEADAARLWELSEELTGVSWLP